MVHVFITHPPQTPNLEQRVHLYSTNQVCGAEYLDFSSEEGTHSTKDLSTYRRYDKCPGALGILASAPWATPWPTITTIATAPCVRDGAGF